MNTKRTGILFLVVVFLMVGVPFASAQSDDSDLLQEIEAEAPKKEDDESDLLKELDEEATSKESEDLNLLKEMDEKPAEETKPKFGFIKQLRDNFTGSVRLRYSHYLTNAEDRDDADLNNDLYDYIFRFNTRTSSENWRVDVDGWAEGGNQKDEYMGVSNWFQDTQREEVRHLMINEFYGTFNQEQYDLTVGKKIFSNGISTLYSPADRFKPQDASDPIDVKDFGVWQARGDYYLDDYTITAVIFPVFESGKQPNNSSRWSGSTQDEDNRDYEHSDETELEEDYPDIEPENISYFARAKTVFRGWDLFFSAFHGLNPYSVIKEETRDGELVQVKKNVKVGNYAAGFSTTYKKWEFHGELFYNHSYSGKDDNYLSGVAGFTYSIDEWAKRLFLEKIDVTIEYAREKITKKQFAESYTDSSQGTRLGKNDLFTRINFKVNEDLSFQYVSNFEFDEDGRYNHVGSEYRLKNGLTWRVALEFFNGSDGSYYGRWWRNDRIMTSLKYEF